MSTATRSAEDRGFVISWPALAASLVAFASLFATSQGSPFVPVLAIALIASRFSSFRLGDKPAEYLPVWLGLIAVVFVSLAMRPLSEDGLLNPRNAMLLGGIGAATLVMVAWRRRPVVGGVIVLALSAQVLWASMNTFDDTLAPYFAPAWVALIIVAARDLGRRTEPRPALAPRGPAVTLAGVLLAIGLGAGFATYDSLHRYRAEMTSWAMNMLNESGVSASGTGMSRRPTLGAINGLEGGLDRVMRIAGRAEIGHMRAAAFSDYSHGQWGPAIEQRAFERVSDLGAAGASGDGTAHVEPLAENDGLLFAPLNTAALDPEDNGEPEWCGPEGGPLRTSPDAPMEYSFRVGDNEVYQGPLCPPLTPEQRRRLLAVPAEVDPRVRKLAAKVAGSLPTDAQKAEALVTYLMGAHRYSLGYQPGYGDQVSAFVLSTKAAHCEYFGSALAILLRCAGVPARYVIGYYAHEEDGPGVTIVRQRDAHAWTEAWIDGIGWVTLDATPGDGLPDKTAGGIPTWRRAWEWAQDRWHAFAIWVNQSGGKGPAAVVGMLAVLSISLMLGRRRRRAPAPDAEVAYAAPTAELSRIAQRFHSWCDSRGVALPPGRTWLEATAEVDPSGCARDFVRQYNAARFGAAPADALPGLRMAIARLEQTDENADHKETPSGR